MSNPAEAKGTCKYGCTKKEPHPLCSKHYKRERLYDIARDSKIKLMIGGKDRESKEEICTFKHVDGMYSLIITPEGHAVHLGATTEVRLVDGIYELIPA